MNCLNCGSTVVDSMKYCSKCGRPVAGPAYVPPVNPAAPPPIWMSNAVPPIKQKSGVGKILLIVGIVFVLLASGIGVAIYIGLRSYVRSTKSSSAYALAESMLRSSPEVKERMGVINSIGVPIGTSKEAEDGTGFAIFTMSVEGEKASGQYVVAMDRLNSKWRVQEAVVKLQDGGEIRIAHAAKSARDEEPYTSDSSANENTNTDSANSNNTNQRSKIVSGGVLNGKATSLPEPDYPAAARAARASGTVIVKVMVDEEGNVISATAVSGHALLRASAVAAARQARFTPTLLSGKAVKVSGTINYNFVANP